MRESDLFLWPCESSVKRMRAKILQITSFFVAATLCCKPRSITYLLLRRRWPEVDEAAARMSRVL